MSLWRISRLKWKCVGFQINKNDVFGANTDRMMEHLQFTCYENQLKTSEKHQTREISNENHHKHQYCKLMFGSCIATLNK